MATALISGGFFGAALTAAGIYQPSTIVSQLKLENWHMLEAFLTATASSTILVFAAQKFGYVKFNPRSYSSIGLFAYYDGNVIGGLLLGTGMALAGSCPGTVLAQAGVGIYSGYYALAGAILAGIVWTGLLRAFSQQRAKPDTKGRPLKVCEYLGSSEAVVVGGLVALFAAAVGSMAILCPPGPEAKIHPITGGLLIGLAQLLSVSFRKTLIGVSSVYEDIGNFFWWLFGAGGVNRPKSWSSVLFAVGILASSWSLASAFPSLLNVPILHIAASQAVAGGFLMVFGARMAGGCTSGHGISGMSLLSISSFITIASALVGGGLTASFLYH